MRAFPGQVRPILEWSIQHPSEAVTAFRHTWDDRSKALMRMLAVVGDAGSSELLRVRRRRGTRGLGHHGDQVPERPPG